MWGCDVNSYHHTFSNKASLTLLALFLLYCKFSIHFSINFGVFCSLSVYIFCNLSTFFRTFIYIPIGLLIIPYLSVNFLYLSAPFLKPFQYFYLTRIRRLPSDRVSVILCAIAGVTWPLRHNNSLRCSCKLSDVVSKYHPKCDPLPPPSLSQSPSKHI